MSIKIEIDKIFSDKIDQILFNQRTIMRSLAGDKFGSKEVLLCAVLDTDAIFEKELNDNSQDNAKENKDD